MFPLRRKDYPSNCTFEGLESNAAGVGHTKLDVEDLDPPLLEEGEVIGDSVEVEIVGNGYGYGAGGRSGGPGVQRVDSKETDAHKYVAVSSAAVLRLIR